MAIHGSDHSTSTCHKTKVIITKFLEVAVNPAMEEPQDHVSDTLAVRLGLGSDSGPEGKRHVPKQVGTHELKLLQP